MQAIELETAITCGEIHIRLPSDITAEFLLTTSEPPRTNSRGFAMTMNYHAFITADPAICGGEPVVRGTRVTVRTVLASLAEGMSAAEIIQDFPTLDEKSVRAVIAFAAASAEDDLPVPAVPMFA